MFDRAISGRTDITSIENGYIYPFAKNRNAGRIPE